MRLREGSLFSGYNGLSMAVSQVFGSEPAWFSEIEPGPSKILAHHWPDVPNHGDITTIDWGAVEPIDILSGGFPCQDVSAAGKRAGLHPGTRSGLWNHMAYAISKLRPRYVVAENVRGLLSAEAHSDVEPCPWCLGDAGGESYLRALGAVLGDLAELGYDAQWCGLRAADIGAPHGRYRIFILAIDAAVPGLQGQAGGRLQPGVPGAGHTGSAPDADHAGCQQHRGSVAAPAELHPAERRGHAPADTNGRSVWEQPVAQPGSSGTTFAGLAGAIATDIDRDGLEGFGWGQPIGCDVDGCSGENVAWGPYEPAIRRWERGLGRVAPAPTEPGAKGGQHLAPRFVEWMQGLPAGHVTDVPGVNRNAQLKALGNGVVPQQAAAALTHMTNHLTLQASA